MKKISFFLAAISVVIMSLTGCDTAVKSGKPGSSGKTQELIIVATNSVFQSSHAVIDSLFGTPQDALNQPEPRYDVVQIKPADFEDNTMFQAHRNILIFDVNPQNINKVYLENDKWSTPQVVIRITAQDSRSLDSILLSQEQRILKELFKQEYRRMDKIFSNTPNIKIINMLKKKYGFSLSVPEEFATAKLKEESDFTWLKKSTKDFDLHIYIFTRQATGDKDFEEAVILDNIDTMLRHHVPGPSEGSYPGVERRDFFYTRDVEVGGMKAVETRGLWRTYHDFMGGPFVCYTIPMPSGDKVLTLMGSVYSPSQRNKMVMKRDLMMQVDGICRSIKFVAE